MSMFTIAQLLGGSLVACFRDTEYFVRGFSSGVSIIGCKFSVSTRVLRLDQWTPMK